MKKPDEISESIFCPVCKNTEQKILYEVNDTHIPDNYFLRQAVQCKNCKLVFLNPVPKNDDEWFKYIKNANLYFSSAKDAANALSRIKKYPPGKILDIGCGNGEFLYQVQKSGWDVTGIELFENDNLYNLPVKYGMFEEMDLPENYFDIVTFWGVTEYLREPLKFFEKVKTVLKNDGKIIFVTSNYYSIQRAIMKVHNFPRQQLIWSMPSIKFLFEKVGLKITDYDYKNDIRNGSCTELITFLFKMLILQKSKQRILLEHNGGAKERNPGMLLVKAADRLITLPLSAVSSILGFNGVINITAKKV